MSPVIRVCGLLLTQPRSQALSPLAPLSDPEKREPGNEANTNCHLLATSLALCYAEVYEFHPSSTLSLDTVLRYVSRGHSLIPNVSLAYFPFWVETWAVLPTWHSMLRCDLHFWGSKWPFQIQGSLSGLTPLSSFQQGYGSYGTCGLNLFLFIVLLSVFIAWTEASSIFRPHYSGGIPKRNNNLVFEKNAVRKMTRLSWCHPFLNFFSSRRRKVGVFKFLRFEERFRKAPFAWPISGNSTLHFSGVVWTGSRQYCGRNSISSLKSDF